LRRTSTTEIKPIITSICELFIKKKKIMASLLNHFS